MYDYEELPSVAQVLDDVSSMSENTMYFNEKAEENRNIKASKNYIFKILEDESLNMFYIERYKFSGRYSNQSEKWFLFIAFYRKNMLKYNCIRIEFYSEANENKFLNDLILYISNNKKFLRVFDFIDDVGDDKSFYRFMRLNIFIDNINDANILKIDNTICQNKVDNSDYQMKIRYIIKILVDEFDEDGFEEAFFIYLDTNSIKTISDYSDIFKLYCITNGLL